MDIRKPDNYTSERLNAPFDRMVDPSYEEMIEIAIHESIQETIANEAVLASILQKTKRIGVYDDEIKELHTTLRQYCETGTTNTNAYILNTLKKIRLTTTEYQLIHSIFI